MSGPDHRTSWQYRGVEIDARTLGWLADVVVKNPRLSRTDIALLFSRRLGLRRRDGAFAVDRCRLFLGRLAKRGILQLPPGRRSNHHRKPAVVDSALAEARTDVAIIDAMQGREFGLRLVLPAEQQRMTAFLSVHHYLGNPQLVGERLSYVATLDGQWVALCLWAAAALKNGPRDRFLGWDAMQKAARLHLIVNNVRFLILPHVRIAHLASRILGANLRVLGRDWQTHYGHDLLVAETFVDAARFKGTCYRASNWLLVGQTAGYGRKAQGYVEHQQKKTAYLYLLNKQAPSLLRAPLPVQHKEHDCMQTLDPQKLPQGFDSISHRFLAIVDQRKARGKRHSLAAIFNICICATLCGVQGVMAIEQWAKAQSREVLKRLGCRFGRAPSERTIRRVLQTTGVSLDEAANEWQAEYVRLAGKAVALDGKALRGSDRGDNKQKHLLSIVTHDAGQVLAQFEIGEKANEITHAIPLLNQLELKGTVVTADAMHTQRAMARYLVEERQADYVLTAKDNQPTLKSDIAALNWSAFPPSGHDN